MKRLICTIILLLAAAGCHSALQCPDRVLMTNPQTGEWQYLVRGRNDAATFAGMAADERHKADMLYAIEILKSKGFTDVKELK